MDRFSAIEHCAEWAETLIHARRTVLPKRLAAPGPDPAQRERILAAASAAPDHGELIPWRFILVPDAARAVLATAFADALLERDEAASGDQLAQAREKAFRAPLLMLAVVDVGDESGDVPGSERLVSAGCALQNMLLMATALGFGSALTSGRALASKSLRALFALRGHEQALCFINIGTSRGGKRRQRERPATSRYVSELAAEPLMACRP